jgi:hypothetical protein
MTSKDDIKDGVFILYSSMGLEVWHVSTCPHSSAGAGPTGTPHRDPARLRPARGGGGGGRRRIERKPL